MPDVDHEDAELPRFEAAYRRVLPEIEALPENELVMINIDVPTAVTTALGAWHKILSLRSELEAKLSDAETLADQLISAVGARELASARTVAASDRRQRAFTLFTSAYDQTRRAISYLRWNQGDLDSFAPSLYAGRGNTKRRSIGETDLPATPTTPAAQPQPAVVSISSPGRPGGSPFTPA
jgi:hypothetical protein